MATLILNCDNLIPQKPTLSILSEWVIMIHYDRRTVIWYKMKFNAIYQIFNDNIQYVLIPKNLVVTVTLFNKLYVTYSVYISFIWLIHLIFVVIVTVCNCFDKNVLSFMFLLYLAFYRTSCWNAMFYRIIYAPKKPHI